LNTGNSTMIKDRTNEPVYFVGFISSEMCIGRPLRHQMPTETFEKKCFVIV